MLCHGFDMNSFDGSLYYNLILQSYITTYGPFGHMVKKGVSFFICETRHDSRISMTGAPEVLFFFPLQAARQRLRSNFGPRSEGFKSSAM